MTKYGGVLYFGSRFYLHPVHVQIRWLFSNLQPEYLTRQSIDENDHVLLHVYGNNAQNAYPTTNLSSASLKSYCGTSRLSCMKYFSKDMLRVEKYLQGQGLYAHVRLCQEKVSARENWI